MNGMDDGELERFVAPVTEDLDMVMQELADGQKQSHWMWFMFPQLRVLGRSETARYFGITNIAEACAFLQHATLGPVFEQLVATVHEVIVGEQLGVHDVFGDPDDLKLVSSLTLFRAAAARNGNHDLAKQCGDVLTEAERQGLPPCAVTLRAIENAGG